MQTTNHILLLVLFGATCLSCGKQSGDGGNQSQIEGIAIPDSSFSGMGLTGVNVDQSYDHSYFYFYDFESGMLTTHLSNGGRNPVTFAIDDSLVHFNRQEDQQAFRLFERPSDLSPKTETSMTGLDAGDPWVLTSLIEDQSALIAGPNSGVFQLDISTGTAETAIDNDDLVLEPRITDLFRSGSDLFLLHNGIGSSGADGSEQIFHYTIQVDGTLTSRDKNSETTEVDGLTFSGSTAATFIEQDSGQPLLISLCKDDISNCESSALQLDPNTEDLTVLNSLASLSIEFHNQIIAAKNDGEIYAHVHDAGEYKVVKIDVLNSTIIAEIHSFGTDDRPYLIEYDSSSDTLFVGGLIEFKGVMNIYRNDLLDGTFELTGVPYNSSFTK